jgi:hypothetical protein
MNPIFTKAIAALVPTGMLLVGSALQFSRRKGTAAIFQLIGAACLIVVVIAHVCEALNWFPWMHWGHEHSVGHYVDLVAAIGGLSLFPIGYLLGALTTELA